MAPIDGITDDNRGGDVIVFVIAASCFSVFFTIIRFGTAIQKHQAFGADDAFFILSLVIAIMQGLTIVYAVHNGLGRHTASLSAAQVAKFFNDTYACRILAATSMGCAKLSVTFMYKRLYLYPSWRINLIPLSSAAGWMLFSVFSLAFQCHLPSPWLISSSHCPLGPSLTIAVAVLNCLSDAVLVVYPVPALCALTMPICSRLIVIALFSTRILVCIMAVIDVTYTARIFGSLDPTWDQFTPVITGIVLVNLSLIIATVPRLHSFLAKVPSGQASTRLPPFVHPNRLTTTNRTGTRAASNSRNNGNCGNTNTPKLVPNYLVVLTTHVSSSDDQTMVAGSDGIEGDKGSAASSSSAQSDGIRKAVRVEYPSRGKSKGEA